MILTLAGDDVVHDVHNEDLICTGEGNDILEAHGWDVRANLGAGDDELRNSRIAEVNGDLGDDRLVAFGPSTLRGGPGDDVIMAAEEHLRGYALNTPCVSYQFVNHAIYVNLTTGRAVGEGHDQLLRLRCVEASPFADVLVGSPNNDWIDTLRGRRERIDARAGNDVVNAGFGPDRIFLGPGHDSGWGFRSGEVVGGPGDDVWREIPID